MSALPAWPVDERGRMGDFILTGSQQFDLMAGMSQSLEGRVGRIELLPSSAAELAMADRLPRSLEQVLWQGAYPALYDRPMQPGDWFANYVATYVERDVRQLVAVRELGLFQRFARMCAARSGQLLNLTALGADCGISAVTARAWLGVLETSYLVVRLAPIHRNFGKRLVKTPKLYFLDTGLAAWLLGMRDAATLQTHESRGALFKTWVVSELIKRRCNLGEPAELFFWRDNVGHEVDVVFETAAGLQAIEIKSGTTFACDWPVAASKWQSFAGREAAQPAIMFGGEGRYERQGCRVLGWRELASVLTRSCRDAVWLAGRAKTHVRLRHNLHPGHRGTRTSPSTMNYLDFLAPYAAGAVHAILLVSWFMVPMLLLEVVVPGQKLNPLTVAFNLLWAPLYLIFAALLLHHVSAVVRPAIPINIFGLQIQDAPPWKLALIVFVYLVLFDLLFYWFHRAQHKWQWMWRFHRFHHSDNNVALLSATRHHWVEESIRFFMIFIPLIILFGNHLQALPWLGIAIGVSGMFIHWNSPLRLGVLTSLVVGPQYHRIHHSVNPEHHDKNFSVMFPFWDRVFGTQYLPKAGEFPRTGLGPDQPNVLLQLSPWPMLQRRRPGMAGRPD